MQKLRNGNGHAPVPVTVTVPVFYANSIVSCCIANGKHCTRRYGASAYDVRPSLVAVANAKFMQSANGYGSHQVLEASRQSRTDRQTDGLTDRFAKLLLTESTAKSTSTVGSSMYIVNTTFCFSYLHVKPMRD